MSGIYFHERKKIRWSTNSIGLYHTNLIATSSPLCTLTPAAKKKHQRTISNKRGWEQRAKQNSGARRRVRDSIKNPAREARTEIELPERSAPDLLPKLKLASEHVLHSGNHRAARFARPRTAPRSSRSDGERSHCPPAARFEPRNAREQGFPGSPSQPRGRFRAANRRVRRSRQGRPADGRRGGSNRRAKSEVSGRIRGRGGEGFACVSDFRGF